MGAICGTVKEISIIKSKYLPRARISEATQKDAHKTLREYFSE